MADCLFCKIAEGKIPANVVAQTDDVLAFRDIAPQAPTHVLIIPRRHVRSLADLTDEDAGLVGAMHLLAKRIAAEEGLSAGYRTVFNTGADGGQTVYHLHLHLLGGRRMTWPPG